MKFRSQSIADMPLETLWVESELVRSLMQVSHNTQLVAWVMIPIFVAVMWGSAHEAALAVWALAALAITLARTLALRRYERQYAQAQPAEQLRFYERARIWWTASGLAWGLSATLFFGTTSMASEFTCWLLLSGIAMLSVNSLSPHGRTMRAYINGLMGTALAAVAWQIVVVGQVSGPYYHFWIAALLVIFWQVLSYTGWRLHKTHRRNFELQYRNSQLIDSLTRQTRAALEAVEIKNRFLASAAHDIRQPVHALGLYADWLASEPELVHEIAPKILQSTRAVNTLFDSLFDLVRLDSGRVNLRFEQVRLGDLLSELELHFRPLAQAKGLQLRVHRNALDQAQVLTDPVLLQRIVGNLVSNAVKYTDRGGVLVGLRGPAHAPRLEVWDTGVGIDARHQRDIFREFFKVPAHSGTEDGFGLGLYIVSRLSYILGHPITLASRPGRGSVFRVALSPCNPQEAAARAASITQLASRP